MSKFEFNPNNHSYTLNGKRLTGVTTIIEVLDKPALIGWASNQAVDYITQQAEYDRKENIYKISKDELENGRKAWCKTRDKAGDVGTYVHGLIEEYANAQIRGDKHFNGMEIARKVILENKLELDKETITKGNKMFDKFVEWATEHQVEFLLSEQKVYSEKHWFAGTVDLVLEIKGKKYIADIKTARDIYNTNYIQMAGYHIALEELGKIKDLEGYIVINIPKQLNKNGEVKLKEKRIYNYIDFKEAFLHCLALYRFINKQK